MKVNHALDDSGDDAADLHAQGQTVQVKRRADQSAERENQITYKRRVAEQDSAQEYLERKRKSNQG